MPDLLVASSTDQTVRIFDTRTLISKSTSLMVPSAIVLQHASAPKALSASPTNSHYISSGGYDGVASIYGMCTVRKEL
ncbi:YTM1_1 [Sanghuangporus weigelae]